MSKSSHALIDEFRKNLRNPIVAVTIALFRMAQNARESRSSVARGLRPVLSVAYRAFALGVAGFDVPSRTQIGSGLVVHHSVGIVIHADTQIGDDVEIRQNTTLGEKAPGTGAPRIESRVSIGPNSVVLGNITVGHDAVIGAGSVVLTDVSDGTTVAGNPARPIRTRT